jgi:uncharacterized tellurite resistance protein B-like protein
MSPLAQARSNAHLGSMLQALKQFLAEVTDGSKDTSGFADDDYRIAAAALLIHTAAIDGKILGAERDRLTDLLKRSFDLDDRAAVELIERGSEAEREAVDLYQFTRQLIQSLDEEKRLRIVEMMWQIAYVDGRVTEFEDNLIWRAADLLGVSRHERIALRQRVAGAAHSD